MTAVVETLENTYCKVSLNHFRKALEVVSTIYSRKRGYAPLHLRTKNKNKKPVIALALECGVLEIRATDGITTIVATIQCEDSAGSFVVAADKYDILLVLDRLYKYDYCILEPFIGFENRQSLRFKIPDDDGGNIMWDSTIYADEEATPTLPQVDGLEFDEIKFTRKEARLIAESSLYLLEAAQEIGRGLEGLFFHDLGAGVGRCVASDGRALNCVVFRRKFPTKRLYCNDIIRYELVKLMKLATSDVIIRFTGDCAELRTLVAADISVVAISPCIEGIYLRYESLLDRTQLNFILSGNAQEVDKMLKKGYSAEDYRSHGSKKKSKIAVVGIPVESTEEPFAIFVRESYMNKALALQSKNDMLDVYNKGGPHDYILIRPSNVDDRNHYVISVIALTKECNISKGTKKALTNKRYRGTK
ncbi:MAG: hypothetical protein KatS3mg083_093 [Candidatus Dojkabacteria bacterium]|nr:MAG: hypothetical protein KatS3mg083_093 [Candidatus Dojkabacteria bacterium]